MTRQELWTAVVAAMEEDINGFSIRYKDNSSWQKFLGAVSVWSWYRHPQTNELVHGYMGATTAIGRTIWFDDEARILEETPFWTLEHEWVHLLDQQTFFGLLPWLPALINRYLFVFCYFLVLPWPGFFRAWAELRAYRRTLELVEEPYYDAYLDHCVKQFTGASYLFMWPFPEQVRRLLQKPSPYREKMDAVHRPRSDE